MSCKQYEEWLALEVGGDLFPDKASQLARHLAECDDCRRVTEELRESQAALRTFHRSPLAEDRLDAVRSAVLAELRTGKPTPFWKRPSGAKWLTPRWALAGAAVALVVTTAYWSFDAAKRSRPEVLIAVQPTPQEPDTPEPANPRPSKLASELRGERRHAVPAGLPQASPTKELATASLPPRDPAPTKAERAVASKPDKAEHEITVISPPQTDTDDTEHNQDTVLQLASSDPDITIYWLIGRNGD